MKRSGSAVALCAALAGCATPDLPAGATDAPTTPATLQTSRLSHFCLAPDGEIAEVEAYPAGLTCGAPNRYVSVPLCEWNQRPARETPEARRRASAADDSLVGDSFQGLPICRLPIPF